MHQLMGLKHFLYYYSFSDEDRVSQAFEMSGVSFSESFRLCHIPRQRITLVYGVRECIDIRLG